MTASPHDFQALNHIGNEHLAAGNLAAAEAAYREAIALNPNYAFAHCNLGLTLLQMNRMDDACAAFRASIRVDPQLAEAHGNLGAVLLAQGRYEEALGVLETAGALSPDDAVISYNRGGVLLALGRRADAEVMLEKAATLYAAAIAARPNDARLHHQMALVREKQGDDLAAAQAFGFAVRLDPHLFEAQLGLATTLWRVNNLPKALVNARRALALNPSSIPALALRVRLQLEVCDWSDFDRVAKNIAEIADNGDGTLDPVITHAVPGIGPQAQLKTAVSFGQRLTAAARSKPDFLPRTHLPGSRIRVGYVSADFYDHPVGRHMIGILASHDRDHFDVFSYSLRRNDGSDAMARFRTATSHWREVDAESAPETILRDGLDILVNLGGYSKDSPSGLMARRLAPIQMLYLGQGGTSGLPTIDYILTDTVVSPPEHAPYFTEKFAYLPETFVNVHYPDEPLERISRQDCGLPDDAFVFCSFNNNYKITPAVFDVWMRLLRAVPDSVLWLRKYNPFVAANLTREAAARDVSADRLIFCPAWPRRRHLARHACADLFLDTAPYNAGSTAADSLWAGLPLLTYAGETFVSRMGASMVRAMGLPELVTTGLEAYFETALGLAQNRDRLKILRDRLTANRETSALFDSLRFTKQLEELYRELLQTI